MGPQKLPGLILFLLLILGTSGCFLANKKFVQTESKEFPPLPQVSPEKQLIILPFENHSKKLEYDIFIQSIPDLFYSFLRFVKTYPFSMDMALLTNETEFFGYFGIPKPTPAQRKKLIQAAIEMNSYRDFSKEKKKLAPKMEVFEFETKILNKTKLEDEKKFVLTLYSKNTEGTHYLLKSTPLTDDEQKKYEEYLSRVDYKDPDEGTAEKYLKLPENFELKVLPPLKKPKAVKDAIFLKGEINEQGLLNVYLFDSVLDKKIFSLDIPLNKIEIADLQENNVDFNTFIHPLLVFLKKFTTQDFYPLSIHKDPEDATLYIDGQFIDFPIVLLPAGIHSVKALKNDYETYHGVFQLSGSHNLSIALKEQIKQSEVTIETRPNYSPVFVNSQYQGLSPVRIKLPEGTHQIRVSREGYEHENYMLKLYSFDLEKKVELKLKKEKISVDEERKKIRFFKNIAFYSFFPFLAGHIYASEKKDYYNEKADYYHQKHQITPLTGDEYKAMAAAYDRADFYTTANDFFRNGSILLLITASIFHILDLQMDDVGIGIDQDKRLGIYIKW